MIDLGLTRFVDLILKDAETSKRGAGVYFCVIGIYRSLAFISSCQPVVYRRTKNHCEYQYGNTYQNFATVFCPYISKFVAKCIVSQRVIPFKKSSSNRRTYKTRNGRVVQ